MTGSEGGASSSYGANGDVSEMVCLDCGGAGPEKGSEKGSEFEKGPLNGDVKGSVDCGSVSFAKIETEEGGALVGLLESLNAL